MLNVREERIRQGLSQELLAYTAGVSVRTVIRAEAEGRASSSTVEKLAHALGVPAGDLFEDPAA